MNLRESVSDEDQVMERIAEEDRPAEENPKVLGVKWYSSEDKDKLEITCEMVKQPKITKRTVTSIASDYDLMGWMLPLMHKAKIYLQSLWRDELVWDAPLPEDRKRVLEALIKSMDGSQKKILRFLVDKFSNVHLVTFADASSEAMAACTYLCCSQSADLLMTKGQLPSLQAKITIPQMELSAITLAMRLTHSVVAQIASVVSITILIILSNSEIVLNLIRANARPSIGPFIENRVHKIRNIVAHLGKKRSKVVFGHIPSQNNPADCATRGLDKTLLSDHFWWKGPEFLTRQIETWKDEYTSITSESSQDSEEE
ncbi:Pao retrotransposon peptidase [Trichostrongylus colubriformis]|uniref:Pao retrotransposon peptidase n=1 Tax=Trichostrongylus colubriformis TaxID=6319 RepID=A0AAN8J3Q0_TRICO